MTGPLCHPCCNDDSRYQSKSGFAYSHLIGTIHNVCSVTFTCGATPANLITVSMARVAFPMYLPVGLFSLMSRIYGTHNNQECRNDDELSCLYLMRRAYLCARVGTFLICVFFVHAHMKIGCSTRWGCARVI